MFYEKKNCGLISFQTKQVCDEEIKRRNVCLIHKNIKTWKGKDYFSKVPMH